MMQVRRYRVARPRRAIVVVAGLSTATIAFALLAALAVAPVVRVTGRLPGPSPSRAYDLLVSPAGQLADGPAGASPADLNDLTGGITLAQYDAIRRLAGVQIAAPMTMVGYVPVTATVPVVVPAAALSGSPGQVAVTAARGPASGSPGAGSGSPYVQSPPAGPPGTVSVAVRWSFLLPLIAVDPVAEARLLHLDSAVISGRYLPVTPVAPGNPVPVIMASTFADDSSEPLVLTRPAAAIARPRGRGARAARAATSVVVGTRNVTAMEAYRSFLAATGTTLAPVPAYFTAGPVRLVAVSAGELSARPAPVSPAMASLTSLSDLPGGIELTALSGVRYAGLRAVTAHRALPDRGGRDGVLLQAVGVFNARHIESSPATPSPYLSASLPGAGARSVRLLDGRPLSPDGDPSAYLGPAATLVMPLQDIGTFTRQYSGTQAARPIGAIRVRVAGASGDDGLSIARVRAVAQEIVWATGLHVTITLAATPVTRTVAIPAGRSGGPAVRVRQVWYRSDTSTWVALGVDPARIALSALVLPVAVAFLINAVTAVLHRRRDELQTLRALGWRRNEVGMRLAAEFGPLGSAGFLLAVSAGITLGLSGAARAAFWWALLVVPAALLLTVAAVAWLVVPRSPTDLLAARLAGQRRRVAGRPRRPLPRTLGRLRLAPLRTGLGVLVSAVACLAVAQVLVMHLAYGGLLAGSLLGHPVVWQSAPSDGAVLAIIVVLAILAIADLHWLSAREQAREFGTLQAMGWPARGIAVWAAADAAILGVLGGALAGAIVVGVCSTLVGGVSERLLAAGAAVTAAGPLLSLAAAGVAATGRYASWRRSWTEQLDLR